MIGTLLFLVFWLIDTVWCVMLIKKILRKLLRRHSKLTDILRAENLIVTLRRIGLFFNMLTVMICIPSLLKVFYDLFAYRVGWIPVMHLSQDLSFLYISFIACVFTQVSLLFFLFDDDDDDHKGGLKERVKAVVSKVRLPSSRQLGRSPLPSTD